MKKHEIETLVEAEMASQTRDFLGIRTARVRRAITARITGTPVTARIATGYAGYQEWETVHQDGRLERRNSGGIGPI